MKKNTDMLRKYLLNETDSNVASRSKIKFNKLLKECYDEYGESDDTEKLLILKTIVTLILKLIYGEEQDVRVEVGKIQPEHRYI